MKISLSINATGEAWQQRYFKTVDIGMIRELAHYMIHGAWSPIVWKDGYRKTDNFISSDYLALDCDDGAWTLESAKQWLMSNKLKGIIGTTKSHQIAKGEKPACDRFRVVVPWSTPIINYQTYRANMENILRQIPADKACKDGARFFFPCKKIEYFQDGQGYAWSNFPAPERRPPCDSYAKVGVIPRFLQDMITNPPGEGSRNTHCFKVAAAMARFNFSEQDAISAVLSMPMTLGDKERINAAKSGYKAGKRG